MDYGKAMQELAKIDADAQDMASDIDAWGAPSECFDDCRRNEHFKTLEWGRKWGTDPESFFKEFAIHYGLTNNRTQLLYNRLVSKMLSPRFQ